MANDIVLETRGLVKKFGDAVILNGIDFTLHDKEVAVILGPSGCGKSTFLRCLIGLEPIQGGNILLKGKPLEFGSTLRSGSTSSRGLTGWLLKAMTFSLTLRCSKTSCSLPCMLPSVPVKTRSLRLKPF